MRNIFAKNYISYALLILASFSLAGIVFTYQINVHSLNEKKETLSTTVERVSEITTLVSGQNNEIINNFYQINLLQIAEDTECAILLCDLEGNVYLYTDKYNLYNTSKTTVSSAAVTVTNTYGEYIGVGTLSDALYDSCYISSGIISDENNNPISLVFVATSASSVVTLLSDVTSSFLSILLLALIISLILSYFIANQLTKPLKNLANASRDFAAGNFSVRVSENNRCLELDEVAVSFNNMAEDLQSLEELSQSFVSSVSHELRTPMTSISGFVDGMLDGTIPKENHEKYLNIISEEVKRLSRLVNILLEAAKIQSGTVVLNRTPFNLSEAVVQTLFSFEQKINAKNLEVEVELDDGVMAFVDKDRIMQVVYNLIDNAVKFATEDGVLSISLVSEITDCTFTIFNTGDKIPADKITHIFDRFYKVDSSRGKDKGGAGLGLYIVKNIINGHSGDISVENRDNGVCFSFNVPLATKKQIQSLQIVNNDDIEKANI